MKTNVGSVDKAVRIIIALVLFSLYFFLERNLRYIAFIGIIPLLTAFMFWCPLYSIYGITTCPLKKS
jgi:Inner membrane protein YgaP-like, transmembrane domain